MKYSDFQFLKFDRPADGVLLITINRPQQYNATNAVLHNELSLVWPCISDDPETRVAVITGAGPAFSAGGDLDEMVLDQAGDFPKVAATMKEVAAIVYNIIDCEKPVISAINGAAVGAGLAVALLADISIAANEAKITDGHLRLGLGAGDHAAIIWPLLCGLAKSKYYLLTADFLDGAEAERIGLVSLSVPRDDLMDRALEVASKLAAGPQYALRWTKRSLNQWIRSAGPIFESSLAFEMLNLFDQDVIEGAAAIKEKRQPNFPSVYRS